MKPSTRKTEIPFDPAALVARVEGFAAGHTPAREHSVQLPPPVKAMPAKAIHALRLQLGCTQMEFAALLNMPKVAAISWENATRKRSGAALRLLAVPSTTRKHCRRPDTASPPRKRQGCPACHATFSANGSFQRALQPNGATSETGIVWQSSGKRETKPHLA